MQIYLLSARAFSHDPHEVLISLAQPSRITRVQILNEGGVTYVGVDFSTPRAITAAEIESILEPHAPQWATKKQLLARAETQANKRYFYAVAAGWPYRALAFAGNWDRVASAGSQSTLDFDVYGGIAFDCLKDRHQLQFALPVLPIWRGVLANVVCYSVVIFVLLWIVTIIVAYCRSWWAQRLLAAGRCPRCRYTLRTDSFSGCPECGWNRPQSEALGEELTPSSSNSGTAP